jgi:hypothetical protein
MTYRGEFNRVADDVYWTAPRVFGVIFVLMLLGTGLGIASCALGLIGGVATNTATVVQKEFYPEAMLRKYEWFKDAAAALDKKAADIVVYDKRLGNLKAEYGTTPRGRWPRDDREQWNIWSSEAAGIRASYNSLAAEYNSEMSKFNWRFANVGDVPPGGRALPREYRAYIEQ